MRALTMQHVPIPLVLSLMVAASATGAQQQQGLWSDPRTRSLQIEHLGPFVSTANDGILCVKNDTALISHDNGATWQAHPIFNQRKLSIRPEHALLRTSRDVIVCVFMDDLDKRWNWNQQTNSADGQIWLNVWSIRSLDQGRTWTDLCQIQSGYCGAIRDMIETDAGDLVVPAMRYLPDGARHATVPYISTDQGLTWKETGLLDIGGRGHHDGSIEPTLVQLRDRRLWMLLRTNLDQLWQSYSSDGGRSWGELTPTAIDASSSPAIVKRLASGRLVLAWNRLYPQGKSQSPRRAGQYSQKPASWQREELSIAFSENDGKTWTRPAVIARNPGKRLSYPWIFERRPGVLWITTMQGGLKLELKEEDWCGR